MKVQESTAHYLMTGSAKITLITLLNKNNSHLFSMYKFIKLPKYNY